MDSSQILKKTLPFVWAKLFLALIATGISILLLLLLIGIGWLLRSERIGTVLILLWLLLSGIVRFAIMHYAGYLVKAGHIAVITETLLTGEVPEDQVAYGKNLVTERFSDANIYFLTDKLISGSVRQIQCSIGRFGSALDFIPGVGSLGNLINIFVRISLHYIDECCLAYTFYKKEENLFQIAADGVVIYIRNWNDLIKNAAKVAGILILAVPFVALVLFVIIGGLFRLLGWSGVIAFILACILTWVVKFAFIDSYVLIRVMKTYMEAAPMTEITFDLYAQLSSLSSKFRELFNRGQRTERNSDFRSA